jgi:hypothetical protein
MSTVAIGVRVPGWDENTWAIACPTPPFEWSVHDLRVFMAAAARCLPSLSPDDLEYELLPTNAGVRVRLFRGAHGEAVTYAPLALSPATKAALGLNTAPVTAVLTLSERERGEAAALTISPMGGAI